MTQSGHPCKRPGRYNLYLGAVFEGARLNKLCAEDLDHAGIVAALDPLFAAYAARRDRGERFGHFTIHAGFVAASGNGADFQPTCALCRRNEQGASLCSTAQNFAPARRIRRQAESAEHGKYKYFKSLRAGTLLAALQHRDSRPHVAAAASTGT